MFTYPIGKHSILLLPGLVASGLSLPGPMVVGALVALLAAVSLHPRARRPLEVLLPDLDLLLRLRVLEAAVHLLASWEGLAPANAVRLRPVSAKRTRHGSVPLRTRTLLPLLLVGVEVFLADLYAAGVELDRLAPVFSHFRPVLYGDDDSHKLLVIVCDAVLLEDSLDLIELGQRADEDISVRVQP